MKAQKRLNELLMNGYTVNFFDDHGRIVLVKSDKYITQTIEIYLDEQYENHLHTVQPDINSEQYAEMVQAGVDAVCRREEEKQNDFSGLTI